MQLRRDPALCVDSSKLLINISNRVDQLQKNFTLNFDALFLSFVQGQMRSRDESDAEASEHLSADTLLQLFLQLNRIRFYFLLFYLQFLNIKAATIKGGESE